MNCSNAAAPSESAITYHADVAPILAAHCVECHTPDGIGPFSLLNYRQVLRRGQQIVEVTESGFMPPWKPAADAGPALIGERRLDDFELNTLRQWFESGVPAGEPIQVSEYQPPASAWRLGKPDLIISLPHSYELPAQGKDIYRNLVLPFPLPNQKFVKSVEIRPGNPQAVHHALLMLDQTGRAMQRNRDEPGVGYDGMGVGSGIPPAGHIIGWTPGQSPHEVFPGTAWSLSPGTDLVLQLHLLPTGKRESINPQLGLYFTDTPPTLSSFIIQLRNFDIDIPAGDSNYRVQESITLPVPVKVIGLYPHAHYIAKDLKIYATLPDSERQGLLHIPDWDFNWQGDYRFVKPVTLPAGATLHLDYIYDNSAANPRNPSSPPVEVRGGWSSFDEMGEAMIQVIPERPEDLARLREAQLAYDVTQSGGEARYHYFNGIYLEMQDEWTQADAAFRRALEIDPDFASAHFKLGELESRQGNRPTAEAHYHRALAIQADLIPAQLALAKLIFERREISKAKSIFQSVHRENPHDLSGVLHLSRFHIAVDELAEALTTFEAASDRFADSAQFNLEFAETLQSAGRINEAKDQLLLATKNEAYDRSPFESSNTADIRSAAFNRLAKISAAEGDLTKAVRAAEASLQQSPGNLDSLLLAASLAAKLEDHDRALSHLIALVNRPDIETFAAEDILANLPMPSGALLLTDAYLECKNWNEAETVIDLLLPQLKRRNMLKAAAQLEARRAELSRHRAK